MNGDKRWITNLHYAFQDDDYLVSLMYLSLSELYLANRYNGLNVVGLPILITQILKVKNDDRFTKLTRKLKINKLNLITVKPVI